MTERNIECESCHTNLGTIRDARLRKDIKYFCTPCDNRREAQIKQHKPNYGWADGKRTDSEFGDIFGDVFGDIFGGKKK